MREKWTDGLCHIICSRTIVDLLCFWTSRIILWDEVIGILCRMTSHLKSPSLGYFQHCGFSFSSFVFLSFYFQQKSLIHTVEFVSYFGLASEKSFFLLPSWLEVFEEKTALTGSWGLINYSDWFQVNLERKIMNKSLVWFRIFLLFKVIYILELPWVL